MNTPPLFAIAANPGAVIVTYRPDPAFGERLAAIARQFNPVIVVDNSADEIAASNLRSLCAVHGAELIENARNRGLAAALNTAFRHLADRRLTWAVAFDQDSVPGSNFVTELIAAASASKPPAAVVGANWHDITQPHRPARHLRQLRFLPFLFERRAAEHDLAGVTCVIASGSLFYLPTWRKLGGFDEGLFLDLVDTDYCLRAARDGHEVCVAARARLQHRRGAKRPIRFLGHTWWPAFMPPLRLRYLFRNRLRLVARHGGQAPHWVAFELIYAGKILGEVLLLEDRKLAKLWACARGTWDGLLGRSGKIAG